MIIRLIIIINNIEEEEKLMLDILIEEGNLVIQIGINYHLKYFIKKIFNKKIKSNNNLKLSNL